MGELVFCSICSMSVGVRLVCSFLMLLHIMLSILPFLTSNVGTVANFFQFVFCSNTSAYKETNFKDPLPVVSVSCNLIQSFLSGLCVPYCMVANLILLVSNASLLVSGWSTKWLSLSYTIVNMATAAQMVGFGTFVIYHFMDRQEVVLLQIFVLLILLIISGILYPHVFCTECLEHFYRYDGIQEEV